MTESRCWCGGTDTQSAPHPEYVLCGGCGTARLKDPRWFDLDCPAGSQLYSADYWWRHQTEELSAPPIDERAALDLSERCVWWLSRLWRHRLPPGRVLEIGCAHGGFLKLLGLAGFEAAGVEMSEEIAAFARQTFGVDVVVGPVERLASPEERFDCICMYDVLEHLPDPLGALCALQPWAAETAEYIIQTPRFSDLRARDWRMFQPPEHLYLYTEAGVRELLRRAGLEHVCLQEAYFAGDMHLVASPAPLRETTDAERRDALLASPDRRVALAMVELGERVRRLTEDRQALERKLATTFGARLGRLVRGETTPRRAFAAMKRLFRGHG